jgi:hypothetical protein
MSSAGDKMNMREKIEHIIWENSNINDHAIDITTDTIMKEVFNTDMREKIEHIIDVCQAFCNEDVMPYYCADKIMATLMERHNEG